MTEYKCAFCKCKFISNRNRIRKFCSIKCKNLSPEGHNKKLSVSSKCLFCKNPTIQTRHSLGKFCSNACQGQYREKVALDKWLLNKIPTITRALARKFVINRDGNKCS